MAEKNTYNIPNQVPVSGPIPIPPPPPRPPGPKHSPAIAHTGLPGWVKFFIVIAIIAGSILSFVFIGTSDAVKVVKDQIALVQQGNLSAAYDLSSDEFRQVTSFEEFVQITDYVDNFDTVKDISFANREISKSSQGTFATLEGTFDLTDGSKVYIYYDLKKEGDDWKIVYMEFN